MKRILNVEYNEENHAITFKNIDEFDLEEQRNILKALGTIIMERHYAVEMDKTNLELPHTKK